MVGKGESGNLVGGKNIINLDSPGIFSFKGAERSSINEITRDLDQSISHLGASLVQQPMDIKSPVFSHKELEARWDRSTNRAA